MYDVLRMHSQSSTEQPAGLSGLVGVEAPRRAAVGVVVARHDDDRLQAAREIPEARQRLAVVVHLQDQVREQPLLLVGLRNRDLVEVDPVGLRVARRGAEEQIVGANRRQAVAVLAGPRRIALARVDDRSREVVGERRRLAAVRADAAQRHRRAASSRSWRSSTASRRPSRRRACSDRPCRGTASSG